MLAARVGIADKEIGNAGSTARIQLFSDYSSGGSSVIHFCGPGGQAAREASADSQNLWNPTLPYTGGVDTMKAYDIMLLSCEGVTSLSYPAAKPQAAMDAVKAYADLGGRIFLSHWHHHWIEG